MFNVRLKLSVQRNNTEVASLALWKRERERERESGRERNEEGVAYSQLSQPQADSQPPASASEPTSHCRPEGGIGQGFLSLLLLLPTLTNTHHNVLGNNMR